MISWLRLYCYSLTFRHTVFIDFTLNMLLFFTLFSFQSLEIDISILQGNQYWNIPQKIQKFYVVGKQYQNVN